jgi:hypothetical protein
MWQNLYQYCGFSCPLDIKFKCRLNAAWSYFPPAKRVAAIPDQVPARIIIGLCHQFFVFKPETSQLAPGV